jgi:hypothetical protein
VDRFQALSRTFLSGADLIDGHSAAVTPVTTLVEQLVSGKPTSQKLRALVEAAAQQQVVADFIGGLKPAVEPEIVTRIHQALRDSAADLILDSLRCRFDQAAEAIAHARSTIGSCESDPSHVLATGTAETIEAWQQLPQHLAAVARIAAIASMFGCRQTAAFSLVEVYGLADNFKIDDRALAVTSGGLVADSALFAQADPRGHTTSPFYRCGGLRLHSIEEMQARYNEFAASEHDRIHGGQRGGHIGEDGQVHIDPVPPNPFRHEVDP